MKRTWALLLVFLVASGVVSEWLRPRHTEYMRALHAVRQYDIREQEIKNSVVRDTPLQALLPTLLGVREVIASILWIQADDYFHRGEYEPIIRMIRQITTIDPHQVDVYATGAWHMAYNFMDKRLIADGVEFLEEGSRNNDSIFDLHFERGYMHYDKTKDYIAAAEAYRNAASRGTTYGEDLPPSYVRHQLAHAYERAGNIDAAVAQWEKNVEIARQLTGKKPGDWGPASPNLPAAMHNLYITKRRRNDRLAAEAERRGDRDELLKRWQMNVELANEWLREFPGHGNVMEDLQKARLNVERIRAGQLLRLRQLDPKLNFTVTRIAPKKLEIEGTCDVLNLARVFIRFEDQNYEERAKRGFQFKMKNMTREEFACSVKEGRFKWLLDLDKDPADMERDPEEVYPLKAENFVVTISFIPRTQSAYIQDRYGWHGEGLTADDGSLVIDERRAGISDGKRIPLRYIRKEVVIPRAEILAGGKKVVASTQGATRTASTKTE